MSTEKMREEFEAAYAAEQKEVYTAHGEDYFDSKECFFMHEDGFYLHDNTQSAWWGWKASRAAIEVDLPGCEVDVDPDHEDYEVLEQQECLAMLENHTLTRCRQAIESLGLKVKP